MRVEFSVWDITFGVFLHFNKCQVSLTSIVFSAHKCDKCDKAFATKSSLQAHLNTHRREPPQSCAECGRAFIRHDCLMRHIRAKHRDVLEDVMAEAEKRQLQTQLLDIASSAALKIQNGASSTLSSAQLLKAIVDLLTILIEEETLQVIFSSS